MKRYRRLTVPEISARKLSGRPVSMVTCYDHWTARILNETDVDCLLVGDSVAMVVHGYDSTVHADTEMMALHVGAVCRGAPDKLVIADMPFLAARKGLRAGMDAVQTLMQAGAHAIKIEGEQGVTELIAHTVESGVPIMGHLGLTPQSVHALGGMRVQGRDDPGVQELLGSAGRLQEAGCFAIVLECVPSAVGKQVAAAVEIPVIGIGAGADTDGQVLVLQDLLGADPSFKPRFVRRYLDLHGDIQAAVNRFHADVHGRGFPAAEESYA
ncbi:MAG: 3-methyl-2-oxobutanoate hydroxymethyltransferase [Gammaproteobacteria bacterium]|nr:3-methyl-2-oxobutanoate hydroxymethyltransferase [Gammaproteobacteria bacterium]